MVLIILFGLALLGASFLHWQRKPADPAPLYAGIAAVLFSLVRPDHSGYDRSLVILIVAAQVLLHVTLAARAKRSRP